MREWRVMPDTQSDQRGRLVGPSFDEPCALGKKGLVAAADGREGDEKTPMGSFAFRQVFYRPDREEAPFTKLPVRPLNPSLGWCDAPNSPHYNKLVQLPMGESHEKLWREDALYDLILVLGHNDAPVVPGLGSCIFVHVARKDFSPTMGCVALDVRALRYLLRLLKNGDILEIG